MEGAGERDVQRRMADVPSRSGRACGAAVVARPVHRVVLLPRRGWEDGRPEVPRRVSVPLRARAPARASRWRVGALERHELRARRNARARAGRRAVPGLLPLPLAAPLPPGPRSAARNGAPVSPARRPAAAAGMDVELRRAPARAAARLGSLPSRDRRRAGVAPRRGNGGAAWRAIRACARASRADGTRSRPPREARHAGRRAQRESDLVGGNTFHPLPRQLEKLRCRGADASS